MAVSIDEKVVEMTFRGAAFLTGVKATISALTSLKNSLNGFKGSSKDINDLDNAAKKFSLSGMAKSADDAAHHFNLLQIAGLTVFTKLVGQALIAGEHILKALTIDPIKAGLDVYETKINAIQTILANTSAAGTTLNQVTTALNQLNTYANQTVYNFGQMAKNIGTFTAAGVDLKTSVESIKGIANLAALSGSSAEQASTAMYQLSQAIAAGKVNLQDWNSVVNAGLGGKVFQNQLIETARASGVAIDAIIKKAGSFRNSLQQGWLTSNILTKTLATFTGDLSAAQLKAMGFTDQEAQGILKQAKLAVQSAVQIRTVSQLFQALGEEVATAWSRVWEAVIGNINQATTLLTGIHTVAEAALTSPINHIADLLNKFNDLGGRTIVIAALTTAFHAFSAVLKTIGDAFRSVFPPVTANNLVNIAGAMLKISEALTPSKKTLSELKTIFEGVFSAIKIGLDVISALFGSLGKIGGAASGAGGGFLSLLATIAKFVTKIKDAIESGGLLVKFFNALGTVLALPVKAISAVVGALGGFSGVLTKVISGISSFVGKIGDEFSKIGEAISNGIKSGNISGILTVLNQVLFGGVLLAVRKFIKNFGSSLGSNTGGGLFASIKESFEGLTGALQAMQQNLKSGTLLKIAAAVAILAASLVALSFVNVGNLTKALTAITVLFTELLTAMNAVGGIAGTAGIVKMPIIAAALNLLATAILILTGAVAILAHFSWEQLTKGLAAVGLLLTGLVVATNLMATNAKGLIATAFAMKTMAVALDVLAFAVAKLGELDFGTLAKGIGSVAALLLILTAFTNFSGDTLISTAASLLIISAALVVMSKAVASLGALSLATLAKGIASIAAVLLILTVAMDAMEGGLPGAAALLVASAALVVLSKALNGLGSETWGEIGKALVLLAGSLLIIAAAMIAMVGALPGAAALLVVSAALAVLTPVLIALGSLSWESIAKGLVALAGAFAVIGIAGLLLAPLVPVLLALGVAIGLLGVGVLAAGAGLVLFGAGITAIAVAVTASGAAILAFVNSILSLIPLAAKKIGEGVIAFAQAISGSAVAITGAFVAIMTAVLNAIIKVVPLAVKAFGTIIGGFLTAINQNAPKILTTMSNLILKVLQNIAANAGKFVTAGANIIVNIFNGISKNLSRVVTAGTNVVINFINAIGNGTQRIVTAGINMVIKLINGIANELRAKTPALQSACRNLGSAIIQAMIAAIEGGISGVVGAIAHVVSNAIATAKSLLHINSPSKVFMEIFKSVPEGAALGVTNNVGMVTDSMETMATAAIDTLSKSLQNAGSVLSDNIDLQPKITPIVDLTQAKKGFSQLSGLSKDQIINAGVSTSSAASISAANLAAAAQAGLIGVGGTNLTFTQNITSPKQLATIDIYRQTRNQLSIARGALQNANAG